MGRLRLTTALAIASAAASIAACHAQVEADPPGRADRQRILFTDREALLLMMPELVAQPSVEWAAWSSDGRYVLARRERVRALPAPGVRPDGDVSLILWSSRTRRATEIWKQPLGSVTFEKTVWLPGSNVALAVASWPNAAAEANGPRRGLLRIDAASGQVRMLGELAILEELLVSPTAPIAVLKVHEVRPVVGPGGKQAMVPVPVLRVLRADGISGAPVRLEDCPFALTHWSQDGRLLYLHTYWPTAAGQPPNEKWVAFDPRTGRTTALEKQPETYRPAPPTWPFRFKQSAAAVKEGATTQPVRPLWLESRVESEQPRALVCADGDSGMVSPDGTALLYVSEGAAWVMPIERRPKAEVLAAIQKAQQEATMSNAKQLGLALHQYAADNGEQLPPNDGSLQDKLDPYLKNRSVFTGPGGGEFVYTYAGGALSAIQAPANTSLGYLSGPGGRAVLYADGHVKWEAER
jgi:prepilin-type processing-associated H-X9-DG protein